MPQDLIVGLKKYGALKVLPESLNLHTKSGSVLKFNFPFLRGLENAVLGRRKGQKLFPSNHHWPAAPIWPDNLVSLLWAVSELTLGLILSPSRSSKSTTIPFMRTFREVVGKRPLRIGSLFSP
jgi:hypothetical protein